MPVEEHNKTKSVRKAKITLTSPKDMFERITQEPNDPKKKKVWSRETFGRTKWLERYGYFNYKKQNLIIFFL